MVTEEITAHTCSQRRPSASVRPPLALLVDTCLKKKSSGLRGFQNDLVVVHLSLCVCGCEGSLSPALPCVCVFPVSSGLAQRSPYRECHSKMGRATFNPHTASSESSISWYHIESPSHFNPNSVKHSRV